MDHVDVASEDLRISCIQSFAEGVRHLLGVLDELCDSRMEPLFFQLLSAAGLDS